MLKTVVLEQENIDRALKRYKKKCSSIKLVRAIRKRRYFEKKSVKRKKEVQKAVHRDQYKLEHGIA